MMSVKLAASGNGSAGSGAKRRGSMANNEVRDSWDPGKHFLGRGRFVRAARYERKPIEWLWEGLIPRGKITLVNGEPGVGKSLFALQVAAMVTRGWTTPPTGAEFEKGSGIEKGDRPRAEDGQNAKGSVPVFEEEEEISWPGTVLLFSAHDDCADTIMPRLEAAGADLSKVMIFQRDYFAEADLRECDPDGRASEAGLFRLDRDLEELEDYLIALDVEIPLIVFDPIDSYLGTVTKNIELMEIINRLEEMAARTQTAVLIVYNTISTALGKTVYRKSTVGQMQFETAARTILMVAQDLEQEDRRLVLPVKLGLCAKRPGMAFVIRDAGVEWCEEPVPQTGAEYVVQAKEKVQNPLVREECSEITRVTNWLKQTLTPGMVASVEVRQSAGENDIAYGTLRRAFKRLGCKAMKLLGYGRWYWRLPGQGPVSLKDLANVLPPEAIDVLRSRDAQGAQGVQDLQKPDSPFEAEGQSPFWNEGAQVAPAW